MESDGRMGLRCVMVPEQADHVVLKEYATIRLMQVMAERDAALVERDHALEEKKAALTERDSAFLQRDIAYAERDAAILERDNALVALDSARGLRALGWNPYKRPPDVVKGCDSAMMLQMNLFSGVEENHAFASDVSMLGFINNSEKLQHQLHHQHQLQQQIHHHQHLQPPPPQQQQQQQERVHHHQQQHHTQEAHPHPHQHQHQHPHQNQNQHQHQHQHQQQEHQHQPQQHQHQHQPQHQQLLLLHQHHQQQQEHQQEQEQEERYPHQTPPPPLPPQQQQQGHGKPGKEEAPKTKRNRKATAHDVLKLDPKKKRLENGNQMQECVAPVLLPVVPYHAQEAESDINDETSSQMEETQETSYVVNTPIPHCSCTGNIEPCYRWGNGGWQSACCTTTLSMHPLPMNPLKKGYRLPGRKMSAGAFQKLVKRLAQEGADLTQPIDLKDYWSKHGTNRYVTIK